MKISVIIPVFNDINGLKDTVISLNKQTLNKSEFEIIVANDGGIENINQYCKEENITCISIVPNMGSYNARNEGIKVSKCEHLAFVDADALPDENWLKSGLEALQNNDYVGGKVELIMKDKSNASIYEATRSFDIEKYLSQFHFAPTVNLFVKKSVIDKIGMFDSGLRSSGDYEFGNRVNEGSYKMGYAADAVVRHFTRNKEELFKKNIRLAKGKVDLRRRTNYFSGFSRGLLMCLRGIIPAKPLSGYNRYGFINGIGVYIFACRVKMNYYKCYYDALKKNEITENVSSKAEVQLIHETKIA